MKTETILAFVLSTILLIIIITSMFAANAQAQTVSLPCIDHQYAKAAVVDRIDEENGLAFLAIPFGDSVFIYTCDAEDLEVGDIVGMLMYDNETPYITDDIILSVTYSGWNAARILEVLR